MKKVFNDINTIARLFVTQEQDEAMTPLSNIDGRGKGRRFYFKGNTAYSYRDDFPLAKIKDGIVYIKDFCPSNTTKSHKNAILSNIPWIKVIFSDDLENPISYDYKIERSFTKALRATSKEGIHTYKIWLKSCINQEKYPITKSKFPLFFDEKHSKLKQMFFSSDKETFDLAKKLIKQQGLV